MELDWPNLIAGGVIGLTVTLAVSLALLQTKRFDYFQVGSFGLRPPAGDVAGRLRVTWEGTEVSEPRFSAVRIGNTGRKPIRPEDFVRTAIALAPEGARQVLHAEVIDSNPPGLSAALSVDGARVNLAPMLFNPGEWVEVAMLHDGGTRTSVEGRIAGVRQVRDFQQRGASAAPLIVGGVFVVLALAAFVEARKTGDWVGPVFGLSLVFVFFPLLVIGESRFGAWLRRRRESAGRKRIDTT